MQNTVADHCSRLQLESMSAGGNPVPVDYNLAQSMHLRPQPQTHCDCVYQNADLRLEVIIFRFHSITFLLKKWRHQQKVFGFDYQSEKAIRRDKQLCCHGNSIAEGP